MYDLRIVVEEIKGFCDMPMHVGIAGSVVRLHA